MKYCKKCKHIHNDGDQHCPDCKVQLVDVSDNNTPVYLLSASGFELERVKSALNDSGIPSVAVLKKDSSADAGMGCDFSEYDLLVPFQAYEKAYDVCVGIGAIKEENEKILDEDVTVPTNSGVKPADEQFEEMSGAKRTTVKVVSAILFLLLVAAVIYGTDFITGFIKNLFG